MYVCQSLIRFFCSLLLEALAVEYSEMDCVTKSFMHILIYEFKEEYRELEGSKV